MVDTLGFRAKFGVIAPSTNTSVQPEFDEMRPRGVTNHFSRIHIPIMPVLSDKDFEALVAAIEKKQEEAIDQVMTCEPQRVLMGMSAETFWDGADATEDLLKRMEDRAGVPVTMGSHACREALKTIGNIKRISVITPYMPVGDENVRRFFTDVGYEVKQVKGFRCNSPVHMAHITPTQLRDAIIELNEPDVDAIIQVGTNLAMARVSGIAEFWLGKPVIAINVAIYWHALRAEGIEDRISGFGQLLEAH